MVGSADVGEIIMRALILRRVGLIEEGGAGTILIGAPGTPHLVRLQGFLTRSGFPNLVLDAATDAEGKALVERLGLQPEDLPLVVCPNGAMLKKPSEAELAICLAILLGIYAIASFLDRVLGRGGIEIVSRAFGLVVASIAVNNLIIAIKLSFHLAP